MNSIGELLKITREEKGYSLEHIARETNISKSYLLALEEERYDSFPGEPYLIGFLRNYSSFLGLPPDEVVTRYKNIKIQEQPSPVEALIIKKTPMPSWVILSAVGAVAAIIFLFVALPPAWQFLSSIQWNLGAAKGSEPTQFTLTEAAPQFDGRIYVGDSLLIPLADETIKLDIKSIGNDLLVAYPQGETRLRVGEEVFLDLNGNSSMDVRLFLKDISPLDAAKGVALIAEKVSSTPQVSGIGPAEPLGQEAVASVLPGNAETLIPRTTASTMILEEDQPRPFSVDVVFRGYAFFRYQVDDKLREEGYFQKGETIRVEASKKAVLWVSNASSFVGRISGNEVEIGRPGEVSAAIIQWGKGTPSGKAQLRLEPLY